MTRLPEPIYSIHKEACNNKEKFYTDPITGKKVLTEYYLKKRGFCCGSGCRHCPYQYH